MKTRPMTANASRLIVEQLAASGVKYVFNNSGSREALFFDELHSRSDVHGILALHEGAATAMMGTGAIRRATNDESRGSVTRMATSMFSSMRSTMRWVRSRSMVTSG